MNAQPVMVSSNVNIVRVTDPLLGNSTGHRWIPFTKANDEELWCFLWFAPEQTVEQTANTQVIWDPIELILRMHVLFDCSKSMTYNCYIYLHSSGIMYPI